MREPAPEPYRPNEDGTSNKIYISEGNKFHEVISTAVHNLQDVFHTLRQEGAQSSGFMEVGLFDIECKVEKAMNDLRSILE